MISNDHDDDYFYEYTYIPGISACSFSCFPFISLTNWKKKIFFFSLNKWKFYFFFLQKNIFFFCLCKILKISRIFIISLNKSSFHIKAIISKENIILLITCDIAKKWAQFHFIRKQQRLQKAISIGHQKESKDQSELHDKSLHLQLLRRKDKEKIINDRKFLIPNFFRPTSGQRRQQSWKFRTETWRFHRNY